MAEGIDKDVLDLHMAVLLRGLMPFRELSYTESIIFAEQQAAVLLKLLHVFEPPAPVEKLVLDTGLAQAIVEDDTCGAHGWSRQDPTTGAWTIGLNTAKSGEDRNFVIAHEIKHILDDGFGDILYPPVDVMPTEQRKEHAASHFATSLTMPRDWIERLWLSGMRDVSKLSVLFDVLASRMRFRLEVLKIVKPQKGVTESESIVA